jgi:maleylacetoacetate isomerase
MQIKFFYAAGANCCERVRWALDHKRVAYELVDLGASEVDLATISPFGSVPAMEIDGRALTESMAMIELLEELFPVPALNADTAMARARVREVCEAVNASIHPAQNSRIIRHFRPDWSGEQMRPVRAAWIANGLEQIAPRLWHDSRFVVGERFTFADIFIAAIYRKGVALGMEEGAHPHFSEHWSFLLSHDSIRASCPPSLLR